MPRDEHTLLDIANAARMIISFTQGMTKRAFLKDYKTQSAVLHQLMVIGEAVKRLSAAFRAEHAHILWAQIAGMRDQLIHAYDTVDIDEVWRTATHDVPILLRQVEPLLSAKPNP
jgi:uncharacterized protein with HEPN domain